MCYDHVKRPASTDSEPPYFPSILNDTNKLTETPKALNPRKPYTYTCTVRVHRRLSVYIHAEPPTLNPLNPKPPNPKNPKFPNPKTGTPVRRPQTRPAE